MSDSFQSLARLFKQCFGVIECAEDVNVFLVRSGDGRDRKHCCPSRG